MSLKKDEARLRRKKRIRKKVLGTSSRPRLTVYRSLKHIYAQLVDDLNGHTLLSVSSSSKEFSESGGNISGAKSLGAKLGEKALEKGIKGVVFDRNAYRYHGRVQALAEAAREKGLHF
jgi:large subunit ribosomal protein L18